MKHPHSHQESCFSWSKVLDAQCWTAKKPGETKKHYFELKIMFGIAVGIVLRVVMARLAKRSEARGQDGVEEESILGTQSSRDPTRSTIGLRLRRVDFILPALLLMVPDEPMGLAMAFGAFLFTQLYKTPVSVDTQLAVGLEVWTMYIVKTIYELTRNKFGSANPDHKPAENNALTVIAFEKAFGIFWEMEWQRAAIPYAAMIKVLNWYYIIAHFIVTFGALALTLLVSTQTYYLRRAQFMVMTVITLITFAAFPCMPPRLLHRCHHPYGACHPEYPFIDTLHNESINWDTEKVEEESNQYAAIPSVHTAWAHWAADMLFHNPMIWPAGQLGRGLRWLSWLHPVITVYMIVITANHYFVDAIVGVVYVHVSEWGADTRLLRFLCAPPGGKEPDYELVGLIEKVEKGIKAETTIADSEEIDAAKSAHG